MLPAFFLRAVEVHFSVSFPRSIPAKMTLSVGRHDGYSSPSSQFYSHFIQPSAFCQLNFQYPREPWIDSSSATQSCTFTTVYASLVLRIITVEIPALMTIRLHIEQQLAFCT